MRARVGDGLPATDVWVTLKSDKVMVNPVTVQVI
jgi:hypothetical protein